MRAFINRLATVTLLSIGLAASALFAPSAFAGEGKTHHVGFHVDQNDPDVMNQTLNNATNVIEYYRGRNEDVDVDIVTYGPGLNMLRTDTSPVADRVKRLKEMVFPGKIQFSACNVTKTAMEKREGRAVSVVPEATMVASGVVHLMELQEQGWSYIRP